MNNSLAIAIPTYERSDILSENLPGIIIQAKENSVSIYISDNSIGVETSELVDHLRLEYDYDGIYYIKNLIDVGHDKNSLAALHLPDADYVWLLGDSFSVSKSAVEKIIAVMNKYNPAIISVNAEGRSLDIEDRKFENCIDVFSILGWHLTLTGASVYSRNVIDSMDKHQLLQSRTFPQIALIFRYLSSGESFYWINSKLISSSNKKKGWWVTDAFSIFIDDWSNAINSLPAAYPESIKHKIVLEHSHKTKVFGFKSLVMLRYLGAYDLHLLQRYRAALKDHSSLNHMVLFGVSVFPVSILRIIIIASHRIRSLKIVKIL